MLRVSLVLALAMPLAGCAEGMYPNQNALMYGAVGAGAGGLFGGLVARRNPALGAAIGAVGGGLVGGLIGRQLDIESERRRQAALQQAAMYPQQPTQWVGRDTGTRGSVQFRSRPAVASNGQTCAVVQETITIGGQAQQADRQTCRQSNGSWT